MENDIQKNLDMKKAAQKQYQKEYYQKNKERIRQYRWFSNNPNLQAWFKTYYIKNKNYRQNQNYVYRKVKGVSKSHQPNIIVSTLVSFC